ncbi:uncharacterized protein L3040_007683 [Drepanopeziza brunnea f. sp. 'multigermtubi']|uniref:Uncharacterized protein n=1 Tax=Marssonina brunnea f. sp. multigermtubi (strain MB_m1) TaxID=1072389 RepID=K1XBR0_MARBU|nr:uncharacterized protein MBM_03910 [Drepanopeziza brunnea f. sp. 'multigermtubi' MB_m1]EKD18138.1 hypothetical protein MBM_03910 [Drepanopeziza brunnea f. sp. 'multigermtubi' MB_m1]KAJ5037509.1 hypothetical protein L3040_007683 [Drepanopeziza brunnea f. sp. 'multigermtubi']
MSSFPSHPISPSPVDDEDFLPILFDLEDDSFFTFATSTSSSSSSSGASTPQRDAMKGLQIPRHPIRSMQAAFSESMIESAEASAPPSPKHRMGDAAARRKLLIDQEANEETHAAARWKLKPGQKYHELWKLIAQISFGVYLLMNGIAKDDGQVMNILQGHVDEVDEFLETTLEDFDLAHEDIEERLKFLKLPLENIAIFDAMLEDRNFRLQIVNGNERIEHVITRTGRAMNDALKDVQQGLDACREFTIYMAREQENAVWFKSRPDMQKVFTAMKGNVEGWFSACVSLQAKGNRLGVTLVQLGSIVSEMDRRAGEVSRNIRFSTSASPEPAPMASPPASPGSKWMMRQPVHKDLPPDSSLATPASRATTPALQTVQDGERTPEPDSRRSSSQGEEEEEEEEPEHIFTLQPTTYTPLTLDPATFTPYTLEPTTYTLVTLEPTRYTPVPSPQPSPRPKAAPEAPPSPPPEILPRNSLRQRFSLTKRKESPPEITVKPPPPQLAPLNTQWGPRQRVQSSAAGSLMRQDSVTIPHEESSIIVPRERLSPAAIPRQGSVPVLRGRQRAAAELRERDGSAPALGPRHDSPVNSQAKEQQDPTTAPPSCGLDSAYFSDVDNQFALAPARCHQSPGSPSTIDTSPSTVQPHSATLIPSPRSDQQYFRVQASPHSPLQRPWTAGPSNNPLHVPSRSSTSNLSSYREYHDSQTPSVLGSRRGAPSAMGMSIMSDTTMMTEVGADGQRKKVKKKRSALGWLKKAFSLSEEEKAAFEEKRLGLERERMEYYKGQQRRWVDGKRVR